MKQTKESYHTMQKCMEKVVNAGFRVSKGDCHIDFLNQKWVVVEDAEDGEFDVISDHDYLDDAIKAFVNILQ